MKKEKINVEVNDEALNCFQPEELEQRLELGAASESSVSVGVSVSW